MVVDIRRADGRREVVEIASVDEVKRRIGAVVVDFVGLPDGRMMLADSLGHNKGLRLNRDGQALYHSTNGRDPSRIIVGDVAIMPAESLDALALAVGASLLGLTVEQVRAIDDAEGGGQP